MGFGVELHEYVRIAQSRTQPICWFHDQTGFHQQTSKVSRYHEDKSHNGQSSFPNAPLAAAPRPRHGSPRLPRPAARYLSRFVPVARPSGNRQFPLPPRFRSLPQTVCLTACSLLVSLFPLPTYAHPRSAADVPEPGPYIHFLSTLSIGDSLRFNNPFRLSHQLGPSGESLSRTPLYSNFGLATAFGDPNGWQHGVNLQWNQALSGLPQHVITPAYLLLLDGSRPWLAFSRVGLPIVLNPNPNVGGELSFGAAYLFTASLGLQTELVGNVFYGAATWEKQITAIPMLSLQLGLIIDLEVLP
ncbi:MAG: hypothetical protein BWY17_02779 [Deltaproteobacteria bacterium ADurb.Bin207]|nr:MAG: hypothetical protein BWY17_02779 [Deltaproteobacteria bacterium ADurb.Bin207]